MNVGIIGTGYVGLTTAVALAKLNHQVICFDIDAHKIDGLNLGIAPIQENGIKPLLQKYLKMEKLSFTSNLALTVQRSDVLFICVCTPSNLDGSADMQYFDSALDAILNAVNSDKTLVIKSTVPIGTGKRVADKCRSHTHNISVVNNPEFLKEGSALQDSLKPDRIIIGATDSKASQIMLDLYKSIKCPKLVVDNTTAEITKYGSNCFLATKISFINMLSLLCEQHGADVRGVSEGMGLDPRIGNGFLNAGMGYGGSCFGKDLSALISSCKNSHVDHSILSGTKKINEQQFLYVMKKLDSVLGGVKDKNILMLGLAFKPGTDDLRDAASIRIAGYLTTKKANIRAHDPMCCDAFRKIFPHITGTAADAKHIPLLAYDVDAIVIVTEWPEYKKINWSRLKTVMKTPVVVDGRNMLDPDRMKKIGYTYIGVGVS